MNKTLLMIVAVLVVGGLGYWLVTGTSGRNEHMIKERGTDEAQEQMTDEESEMGEVMVGEETITYTDDGFSPQTVTVKAGTTVAWVNENSREMWPATAAHPTHTVYPGSSISKCGTAEEETIFDACQGIPSGGSYSFTFNEVGDWKYHNHLAPTNFGSVVVE